MSIDYSFRPDSWNFILIYIISIYRVPILFLKQNSLLFPNYFPTEKRKIHDYRNTVKFTRVILFTYKEQ